MQLTTRLRKLVREWYGAQRTLLRYRADVGFVRFGSFLRNTPLSPNFGCRHGMQRVGRYYVDRFIRANSVDICGNVLEIGDDSYTRLLGGNRVAQSDVLHAVPGNAASTIVADLSSAPEIRSETYDCIVCTQTLQCIYPVAAAVATLHRILRIGGVVLGTVPGISQISRYDMDRWGDCWRFTTLSVRLLFEESFGPGNVDVCAHGNVMTALALLHGLSIHDLRREDITYDDPDYEVIITVRATKRT